MFIETEGANELSLEELEALFREEEDAEPPAANTESEETPPVSPPPANDPKKEVTKGVAERIKAVRLEEQNAIAKQLGYDSYANMMKAQEDKLIKDKGYDPKDLAPVVDELVKTRLENDPRIKDFEALKKERVAEFAKRELAEIARITNGEISTIDQVPRDVLEDWKKSGSLKSSFLLLKGEDYIVKARTGKLSDNTKGGTNHLKNLGGGSTPPPVKTRPLTNDERIVWKQFHPNMSEEDLDKKTMPVE